MTLLAKLQRLVLSAIVLFLLGCQNGENEELELDPGNAETQVLFQEFDLATTSILVDSLRTDGTSQLIVGANTDSVFGEVSVNAYAELAYRNGTVPVDTLRPESGTLYLEITDILSSGAFVDQELEVRLTTEPIFESAVYLSDDELETSETVIARWPLVVGSTDSLVSIDLEFSFIERFWSTVRSSNNISELDYGIEIRPSDPNGGMAAIEINADSSFLEILSRDVQDSSYLTFFVLENQAHNIERDRAGSALEGLSITGDETDASGISYINSMAGIYTKVDLSPFQDFIDNNPTAIINNATLELPILDQEINNLSQRIEGINFFFEKPGTVINGPGLIDDIANSVLAPEEQYSDGRPQLSSRVIFFDDDAMNYDESITLFSQFYLTQQVEDDDVVTTGFILIPSIRMTTQQSAIVASEVKLQIFYTEISQ